MRKRNFNYKFLALEIFLHIIQPYPYEGHNWVTITTGKYVTYSVSASLFAFSIFRLYVCLKIVKYWNFYSNEKTKRISKFFKNRHVIWFLYKANIKARGFFTMAVVSSSFVYLFALVYKIYEDYEPVDTRGDSYIWNSLWYLVNTMTTSKLFIF